MELSNNPYENISFEVPELTSASIEQYISQLETNWEIGHQLATLDGIPYSRIYRQLSFPNNPYNFSVVDLGVASPEYESNIYYLVSQNFQEISYSSNQTKGDDSWLRWKKVVTNYRQEITYLHKSIGTLNWQQPVDVNSIPIPIVSPYKLPLIKSGKALGMSFNVSPQNQQVEVRLKSTVVDPGILQTFTLNSAFGIYAISSLMLLTQPLIEITLLNVSNVTPVNITFTFYGEYKWRVMIPLNEDESQEQTLIHPIDTAISSRLKPPGLSNMPDNFWNSNSSPVILTDYAQRLSSAPGWN
jgi:hypothetical protein